MSVICTMCGRDNPSHLMFCQECGQKLAVAGTTGVAPTEPPPAASPLAATAAAPGAQMAPLGSPPAPNSIGRARPAAPSVSFARRGDVTAAAEPLPGSAHGGAAARSPGLVSCGVCGSPNQPGLRFCITCGQPIGVAGPEVSDRLDGIELSPMTFDEPQPRLGAASPPVAPIAPARVIDLGPATPRHKERQSERQNDRQGERSCPRCRGACESTAQFCRFCGLSLATPNLGGTAVVAQPGPPSAPRAPRVGKAPSSATRATAAELVLIARDGTEGSRFAMGESVDIGRLEGDILFADDPYVSPRHARIAFRQTAFYLVDLESTNGVFVRVPFGAPPTSAPQAPERVGVGPGDASQIDKITMRGHHAAEPVPELRSEQALGDQELFLVGQQVLKFEVVKHAEEGFGAASENGTLLFGTPIAPRFARLSQRTVEGLVRDVYHVRKAETVIGRESGDIVFTDDPFLSRRHAAIRMHGGPGQPYTFTIADLGSSNGTFLRVRGDVRLRHGDHFRIGQQLLRFDLDAGRAGA